MNDLVAPIGAIDFRAEAHRDPWSVPLDEIDVSNPYLYSEDTWHGFFARLRRDDPVHFCDSPLYGPYWSVTRYRDIMTVDTSHQTYSSDAAFGGITLKDVSLAVPQGKLHRDGPAAARRAAQDRGTDRGTTELGEDVRHDPRAGDPHPGRPAARRGVRLGRSRLDRADDADAVDPVRLPVRGAADA